MHKERDDRFAEALVPADAAAKWAEVTHMVLDSLASPNSRRAYKRALEDFEDWLMGEPDRRVCKQTILRYRQDLVDRGLAASSVNQRLSAIRKLLLEASDNFLIPLALASSIARARGLPRRGVRIGCWLDSEQVRAVLQAAEGVNTLTATRDRAILATLFSTGLRRAELVSLKNEMLQQRDGRHLFVNVMGKGGRVRSIVAPGWLVERIQLWTKAAGIDEGILFRSINKVGTVGSRLSAQSVVDILARYARLAGLIVRPHDARRTFAALAYKGGARLEQVQLALGHASLQTTERYLGFQLSLHDPPCDHLDFE